MLKIYLQDSSDEVLISDIDYLHVAYEKWYKTKRGYIYRKETNNKIQKAIYLHIFILKRMGYIDFERGDHKDKNPLNCQRDNLRVASISQNGMNSKIRSDNTSGYKGVSFHIQTTKWRACIQVNSKQISLGLYETIKEAAVAYNIAAIKYHKEFAVLNEL